MEHGIIGTGSRYTRTVTMTTQPDVFNLEDLAAIEARLAHHVAHAEYAPNLRSAVEYALLGGGKRLRPTLVLACARAAGGSIDDALDAAAAIEMVHAFSLVHDDLPALDNDDLRRGRPTLHRAMGEAMAILAGDALLALAFQAASASPRGALRIVMELSRATNAMITGQVHDTLGGFPADLSAVDRLERIHANKTGALLVCSCRMGALSAGAPEQLLSQLTQWGTLNGVMFQAVDDLIDETQTAEHAGKAVGKDRDAGKLTYPIVHGLERTRSEIERLRNEALETIAPLGPAGEPLGRLTDYLAGRTR
jgi:geranylgeranyl diphosphate synthase type II